MSVPNNANTFLPITPVVPGKLIITAISNSFPMAVTFIDSIYNSYSVGQNITFTIPSSYGMFQLNNLTGTIVSINSNVFSVNIDSRQFDVFAIPNPLSLPTPSQPATLAPGGSSNIYNITTAPFRSLNDTGN